MSLKGQTRKGMVGKTSIAEPCSVERAVKNLTKLIWSSYSLIPKINILHNFRKMVFTRRRSNNFNLDQTLHRSDQDQN